jgi:hypothetical protein
MSYIGSKKYKQRLKDFIACLDKIKQSNSEYKSVKVVVSDSTNCLPTFKIMSSQNTDMELRLFSYDAFYNMFDGKVISRYDDKFDPDMENGLKFTYLKTGKSGEINWKESVDDTHKEVETFLDQSFKTLETAIDKLHVSQSEV